MHHFVLKDIYNDYLILTKQQLNYLKDEIK